MEDIIKAILALLFGVLFGYAVFKIAVTVKEVITKSNISRIVRNILAESSNKKAQKWLAKAYNKAVIKDVSKSTITLSMLEESGSEVIQMKVTGERISSDLQSGATLYI